MESRQTLYIKLLEEHLRDHYLALKNHATDSGFDLIMPRTVTIPGSSRANKIGLGIAAQPKETHGYFLMPRSSISKTPLRLANSIGLIDAEYRGELTVMLDNISTQEYTIEAGTRLFQIVFPNLKPFDVAVKEELTNTVRGTGGFGSTGV